MRLLSFEGEGFSGALSTAVGIKMWPLLFPPSFPPSLSLSHSSLRLGPGRPIVTHQSSSNGPKSFSSTSLSSPTVAGREGGRERDIPTCVSYLGLARHPFTDLSPRIPILRGRGDFIPEGDEVLIVMDLWIQNTRCLLDTAVLHARRSWFV